MSEIAKLLERFDLAEGFSETPIKGVRLFKALQHIPRTPLLYDPGICIVAQGHKIGYLGGQVFQYDADNYLVVSVSIPFECETFASPDKPLLGLYIDVDMTQLHDLISYLGHQTQLRDAKRGDLPQGVGPAHLDREMADATVRLLRCLQSDTDAQVLGPGRVREILYRTLCGTQAAVLYALAAHNGNFSRVAHALKLIQTDFAKKLDIERLAREAGMSVSAFHRAFKEITSDSPMQYLKKIRLNRAKDFLMQEDIKAYIAADKVGYESASQFSREFKRYFGKSPAEMVKKLHSM